MSTMSPAIKNFLLITIKNAVNAVLTDGALMVAFSSTFHLHTWQGVKNLLISSGIVVATREATVWGPIVMRWSQTNATPSSLPATSAPAAIAPAAVLSVETPTVDNPYTNLTK
jgi:hypothetical protein